MKSHRILLTAFAILLSCTIFANGNKVKFNYGIKAGFQAVAYNSISFNIDGYRYDDNTIHSNKIGYSINPFIRLTKNRFYLQTEAAFGVTYHNFNFFETNKGNFIGNDPEYKLTTYCIQVPLLLGYNFINYDNYGMSIFTGPRTRFILTSMCDQDFSNFKYDNLAEKLDETILYWELGVGIRIYNIFLDITYDWGIERSKYILTDKSTGQAFTNKRNDSVLSFSVGCIF